MGSPRPPSQSPVLRATFRGADEALGDEACRIPAPRSVRRDCLAPRSNAAEFVLSSMNPAASDGPDLKLSRSTSTPILPPQTTPLLP
jgi:hypothetical protein